jgi:hypothetical protein
MERLTEWNGEQTRHAYYPRCFEEPCYGSGCKIKDCPFETAVCERLAAYEDTGLEPEAVETVKLALCAKRMVDLETLNNTPISRLVELAEADKDGRVVVLPCKVGETVYFVNGKQILEFAVVGYAVDETGISWVHSEHVDKIGNTNERTFSPDRFGKNTFFTHEEAEKALQEMEGAT